MKQIPVWNLPAMLESPLFAPMHPVLARFNPESFPTLEECNALLEAGEAGREETMQHESRITVQSGARLRFVPQEYGRLPFDRQYEPRCYLYGEVPTRAANWHDLFNALVWLTFPRSKAAINARHYRALHQQEEVHRSNSQRGEVRDVNTLLDESGVIVLYADAQLAGLLQGFKWKELFWQRREQVEAGMGFYLFGHGLYEKALRPYVGMTGQGLLLEVEPEFFLWPMLRQLACLDQLLADVLTTPGQCGTPRDLTPVPLLGVPGWSADNQIETYYDNPEYFRLGRRSRHIPLVS